MRSDVVVFDNIGVDGDLEFDTLYVSQKIGDILQHIGQSEPVIIFSSIYVSGAKITKLCQTSLI